MFEMRRERVYLFLFLFIAAVFVVLKMIRGFSGSEEQGGIWNIIQALFVGVGVLVWFSKENSYRSINCIRIYLAFSLYLWFLAIFPFIYSRMGIVDIYKFITIPYGIMVLLTYYWVGYHANIKQFPAILWIAFVGISIILFVAMRSFRVGEGDQGALADIYYIVTLLPLILLYTPQRYKLVPFLIAFVCVVMTGKRGAFVAMTLILIIYFFLPYSKNRKKTNPIVRIIVFATVLAVTYFAIMRFVGRYNLNIFDRLDRIEEDGGSGRLNRWETILVILSNDSFLPLLFGHGSGSLKSVLGGHAHNDFLEFFFDYGIFAVIMYILFFISLFREGFKMYRYKYPYAREFMCSVVIAFCMALFSFYAIASTHITTSSICFGLLLSDWNKFKSNGYQRLE